MSLYKRGNIWWIRFQAGGKTIRRSSGTANKRKAEEFETELRERYRRLKIGARQRYSYNELVKRFMEQHLPNIKPSSQRRYLTSLLNLNPHFNGLYIDEINRAGIASFEAYRQHEAVSGSTIRRDVACLSVMLGCAVNWELLEINVSRDYKSSVKESPPRRRYLSYEEYDKLIEAAKSYLKPMIIFAVETGLRLEEQLSLTWPQIDFKREQIKLEKTKSGKPRIVPLSGEAKTQLWSQVRHLHSPYVFCKKDGSRYGKLTRGLAGTCKRAGITNLQWHDLRRTCGSWLLQSGVDIYTVKEWLGHSSVAVTEKNYAFLDIKNLHEAAKLLHKNRHRARGLQNDKLPETVSDSGSGGGT